MSGKRSATDALASTSKKVKANSSTVFPVFQKALYRFKWSDETVGASGRPRTCLHGSSDTELARLKGKRKIAAFDMDGWFLAQRNFVAEFPKTLIKPKGKAKFATSAEDWQFAFPNVTRKLQELHSNGHSIVILSNQNYALTDQRMKNVKTKLPAIASVLNVPLNAFLAFEKDYHRKPMPGMFELLQELTGESIDMEESFFVGDAAGRAVNSLDPKGDHSAVDLKFALNAGLRFFTPEQFFLGSDSQPTRTTGFDAAAFVSSSRIAVSPTNLPINPQPKPGAPAAKPEVVIFVGPPASGKSTFYETYFASTHVHVNQDKLKTKDKCLSLVRTSLEQGQSVVVDNTNRDQATRADYLAIARTFGARARAFCWSDMRVAWHNNLYRSLVQKLPPGETRRSTIPATAFSAFQTALQEPRAEEGFDEVRQVSFAFQGDDEDKRRYSQWLEFAVASTKVLEGAM